MDMQKQQYTESLFSYGKKSIRVFMGTVSGVSRVWRVVQMPLAPLDERGGGATQQVCF